MQSKIMLYPSVRTSVFQEYAIHLLVLMSTNYEGNCGHLPFLQDKKAEMESCPANRSAQREFYFLETLIHVTNWRYLNSVKPLYLCDNYVRFLLCPKH